LAHAVRVQACAGPEDLQCALQVRDALKPHASC
jgi:hypothetical protein